MDIDINYYGFHAKYLVIKDKDKKIELRLDMPKAVLMKISEENNWTFNDYVG